MLLTADARGLFPIAPTPFAQRQPAAPMSAPARTEVDHPLTRLARHEPRAHLA